MLQAASTTAPVRRSTRWRFSTVFAALTQTCQWVTCGGRRVHYTFWALRFSKASLSNEPSMADQIVITEKTSQAKDIRAAVGSRYGDVLPAEGHSVRSVRTGGCGAGFGKRWSPILLRPEGLYGTRPAEGGNKAAKLRQSERRCARPNGFGWLPTAIARVSSSARRSSSIYGYRGR